MYNKTSMSFLICLFLWIAPAGAAAAGAGPGNTASIAGPDRGNFEGDVSDAAASMLESLTRTRRDKFFIRLARLIKKGDTKTAEELLENRGKDVPDQKNDEAYAIAKSQLAYAKGDYPSAYAEADDLMARIEKAFAPQKPYEVDFKNKNERDTVHHVYILRFQALSKSQRHEEALADLNRAQRLVESPELFRAKASTLLWLKRYAEAAAAADKAYAMDKNIFMSSQHTEIYCQNFKSQGYKVKACENLSPAAK